MNCLRYSIAILFVCAGSRGFAASISLTSSQDAFGDSTERVFNYGGATQYYVGNRSGDNETVAWIRWDYSSIASNSTVLSAICTLRCATIEYADSWYVRARRLDSAWVEGTGSGSYQFGSSSWNNQGVGTGCDGSILGVEDSCWGMCGTGIVPPSGGAWSSAVIDSEIVNSTSDSLIILDLTGAVQHQLSSGSNFGFHISGTSPYNARRVQVCTREHSNPSYRPKLFVEYAGPSDSAFVRIHVNVPSAPLLDYPVLISYWVYPGFASDGISVFNSDSTTKLYWWPDSISGHFARIWVMNDWSATTQNIYVSNEPDTSYQKSDSVFLLSLEFDSDFQITQPVSSMLDAQRFAVDTVRNGFPAIDILASGYTWGRELGNPLETDSGHIIAISVGFETPYDAQDSRDSVFCAIWRSLDFRTWIHEGLVVVSDDTLEDTLRIEDPYLFEWQDTLFMAYEDKRFNNHTGSYDEVGLLYSVDQGVTWDSEGIIVQSAMSPTSPGAPSSPVIFFHNGHPYYIGEGKNYTYILDGVPVVTGGGVLIGYTGPTLHSMTQIPWYNSDGDDDSVPLIPYVEGRFGWVAVPDAYWYENGNHYVTAHTQNPSETYRVTVLYSPNPDSLWTEAPMSQNGALWGTTSPSYRTRSGDPQLLFHDGHYYGSAINSFSVEGVGTFSQVELGPMVKWDTTGNPNPVVWVNKSLSGATGYVFASGGALSMEMEPVSERSACGFYTADSFQTGFAVELYVEWNNEGYPGQFDPYFTCGMGSTVVTSVLGPASTSYEISALADGISFGWQSDSTVLSFRQPRNAARTVLSSGVAGPSYTGRSNRFTFAMLNDTVQWGFWNNLTRVNAVHDTVEQDWKRIGLLTGTHTASPLKGGRVKVSHLRVRKYVSGGGGGVAQDTLYHAEPSQECPPAEGLVIRVGSAATTVELLWTGEDTGTYIVYASAAEEDFPVGDWSEVARIEAGQGAGTEFAWTDASGVEQRFYVVVHECGQSYAEGGEN